MEHLTEEKKELLDEFVEFVAEELSLMNMPKVIVQNGRGKLVTTASYNYQETPQVVRVNGKNRALVDIMRSVAHEMVHHKQYEEGRLKVKPKDIGGEIEDEANAKAGQYIKLFAKKNKEIYED
jgi:hypothetical protein